MHRRPARKPPPNPLDRYRVPILDRTLDLLELLSRHPDGLTLAAMTEALKIPKNSVFRIATTLALRGYAERDEPAKTYRAGRKLLTLGHAAVGGRRLVQVAAPLLDALRDETGETALIGTLAGHHGVVLDQVPSSHPVKVVIEIGHAFPLHSAAPAKAMLAFLEPSVLESFLKEMTFTRFTRHTLTSPTAYRKELKQVRSQGYALDRGEDSETCACAAAPVFGPRGTPVAALWISGPVDRVTPAALPGMAAVVKKHAAQLSLKLGFHPHSA
jgi:DNA-binding IclR family transcriptional regulator